MTTMRELRNTTTALAMFLALGIFAACATRDSGPQSGLDSMGGGVTAPAAAAAQPAVPGTPDNPTQPTEPAAGVTPGPALGGGGSEGEAGAVEAAQIDCSTVRCVACPEGQTPRLKPPNCCRCVPIDQSIRDCSNVRCAACPEGQHPILRPTDCCRCVPN